MALSNEDKKDVARHMGKALAKRVAKATIDGHTIKGKKPRWGIKYDKDSGRGTTKESLSYKRYKATGNPWSEKGAS